MTKNLEILLKGVQTIKIIGNTDIYIDEIFFDTRSVGNHDVFIAIIGTLHNGHNYIEKAIELGAKVIICQDLPQKLIREIVYIQTENSAKTLGIIAANTK